MDGQAGNQLRAELCSRCSRALDKELQHWPGQKGKCGCEVAVEGQLPEHSVECSVIFFTDEAIELLMRFALPFAPTG